MPLFGLVLRAACGGSLLPLAGNHPMRDQPPNSHPYTPAAIGQPVQGVFLYVTITVCGGAPSFEAD